MGLTQRKPRPLVRDTRSLRDDRLFIIACDDTYAPQQYFNFFRMPRIQVHVIKHEDNKSHASHVLEKLREYPCEEDDERWMLLDTDHCIKPDHIRSFIRALKDAEKQGIRVALSRSCFEVWLLLHHVDEAAVLPLKNARETEAALREALGGQYDKTNLKAEHYPFAMVREACLRAGRLDEATQGGLIPKGNTSRVYLLWQAIVAKSLDSQLPLELRGLFADGESL